jgi:hypothetical protein
MSIVRDDGDERRLRVDQMLEEFRNAQRRRRPNAPIVKDDDRVAEPESNARAESAPGSTVPPSRSTH